MSLHARAHTSAHARDRTRAPDRTRARPHTRPTAHAPDRTRARPHTRPTAHAPDPHTRAPAHARARISHNNSRDGDYNECNKIVEYDDSSESSLDVLNSTKIHETIKTQINNYKMRHHKNFRNASIDIIKQIPTDDNGVLIISTNESSTIADTTDYTDYSNTSITETNIQDNETFMWENILKASLER